MPDSPDRSSLGCSEQDMAREAMKRLGDWMTTKLDLAVGLDVFPEDFQTPADCGIAEMRGICLECSNTFMASISGRILSCGNIGMDVFNVIHNESAKALFRGVIESMITARYIMDGKNSEENISRSLREECSNWRSFLRMQERNTLGQWTESDIEETRENVRQIQKHHRAHFQSDIKGEMITKNKFDSVVKRLNDSDYRGDAKRWGAGYDLYQEMSPSVHASGWALRDYGSLHAGFLWVAYAFAENLSDYREFIGLDPRSGELTQEALEMMDTWPRP